MMPQLFIIYGFVFFLGACIGSFLNVCIYRMPREISVVFPPSHCPGCKKPIKFYNNIPLFSWLLLRGRCRDCGSSISFRYFFVEFLTGCFFLGLLMRYGISLFFGVYALLSCILIAVSFIDIDFQIIPDELSLGGIVVGLVLSAVFPQLHRELTWIGGLRASFYGVLFGGLSIYLTGVFGNVVFRKESMGGGDVKLLAMIGAFIGWKFAILTFFIAPFFGAVIGIVAKLKYKKDIIPYGPFLSIGAIVSLLYGDMILYKLFNP